MVNNFITKDGRKCIIRQATEDDAEQLLSFIKSVVEEEIYLEIDSVPRTIEEEKKFIRESISENRQFLVAVVDEKIIGDASAWVGRLKKNKHTALMGIAIQKEYRGLGIGKLLMEQLIDWLKSKAVEKIWLTVFSTNKRAIALYEKIGFEIEGIQKNHIKIRDEYIDRIFMAKWL